MGVIAWRHGLTWGVMLSFLPASGIIGLELTFLWIPGALFLIAAVARWRFPLDRAKHAEILAALDKP